MHHIAMLMKITRLTKREFKKPLAKTGLYTGSIKNLTRHINGFAVDRVFFQREHMNMLNRSRLFMIP